MLTIEFLFKDGGVTFSEADNLYGVHRYRLVILTYFSWTGCSVVGYLVQLI